MARGHGPNPGAMGDSPLPPHIPQAKFLPYPREEENSHPKRHNSPKPPPGLRGEGEAAAAATSGVPPPALGTILFFGDFGDPPGVGFGVSRSRASRSAPSRTPARLPRSAPRPAASASRGDGLGTSGDTAWGQLPAHPLGRVGMPLFRGFWGVLSSQGFVQCWVGGGCVVPFCVTAVVTVQGW